MRAWFLSDLHLKEVNERNGNILLRFLHSLKAEREATHLFLLGDIFDFWVGDQKFYSEKFQPFIEILQSLKSRGLEILYIEGNHDVHVLPFWRRLGIACFVEDQYVHVGRYTLRLSHGDLMNPQDQKYLRYRAFIRKWYMEKLAHRLPAREFEALGKIASRRSRQRSHTRRVEDSEELRDKIRAYASRCYMEKPFDMIISGHMHVRDDWQTEQFRSINLGSWFDQPQAFWLSDAESGWEVLP